MNILDPHQWYREQEKKREDSIEKNHIHLLNKNLQRLLHQIDSQIDRENYEDETELINKHLVQSSIWDLSYANNFESKKVAYLQGLFIAYIIKKEKLETYFEDEVDRYMRMLGNFDWSLYGEYNRKKGNEVL